MSNERLAEIRQKVDQVKVTAHAWQVEDAAYLLELLDQREKQIERMKVDHQVEIHDMMRDARDAAAEARWEAKQGDDFGSY